MGCVCPGVREGLEATAAPPYLGLFGDLPPDDPGEGNYSAGRVSLILLSADLCWWLNLT